MTLPVLFSAVALLICVFSFIGLLRYIRLRTGAKHILEEVEEEVSRLIADIDAVTDRDITLLEDRSAAVKAMLETLDRRIAAYARELEGREKQEAALDALASGGAARKPGTEDAYAALGRGLRSSLRVDAPAPPAAVPAAAAPSGPAAIPAGPSVPAGTGGEPAPEDPAPQPRFTRSSTPVKPRAPLSEQAQELYRSGFSPEIIAVRLGATVAEVNLALALALPDAPTDNR